MFFKANKEGRVVFGSYDNLKMVLEKHRRQNNQPIQEDSKILDSKFKKQKEQKILKYEKY